MTTPISLLWESADPGAALTERFGFETAAAAVDWLAEIARLTVWLGERGIPVSVLLPAGDGRVQMEVDGVSLGLQQVIEGELLDITDPAQVRAAGEMLARMHVVMSEYPGTIPTAEPPAPGAQLVGNDFRSANILWTGGRIVAVLDLEESTYRRRVDDLAKAAVLLGTRYHDWAPTPAEVREAFVAAYASVLPPEKGDAGALEDSIEAHLAYI